jgi:ribosomal protein L11 methyltransferase
VTRDAAGPPVSADGIEQAVCDLVAEHGLPMTLRQVERAVSERLGISKRPVRGAIRSLVRQGRFAYSQRSGTAHLEKSFREPERVSDRIWLCPARPGTSKILPPDQIVVRMHAGAAFGIGDHPTTRLSLRVMDRVLAEDVPDQALDIGTGTGVLAIAAALLGVRRVLAVDVDACARAEAAVNAAENALGDRVEIKDLPIDRIQGHFSLVCANLRPPTLSEVAFRIERFSMAGAVAVLSGFRPEEWPALEKDFHSSGWQPVWKETEIGWMAVACRRTGQARRPV